jgi:hypothetical protein
MTRFRSLLASVCLITLMFGLPANAMPRNPDDDLGSRIIRIIRHLFSPSFGAVPKDDFPGPTHP